MEIILIKELIGTELRSRVEAKKVLNRINSTNGGEIVIDFSDVTFISRSFADELCGVIDTCRLSRKITEIFKGEIVDLTLEVVRKNRNKPKNLLPIGETKEFDDMKSLSEFLSTI